MAGSTGTSDIQAHLYVTSVHAVPLHTAGLRRRIAGALGGMALSTGIRLAVQTDDVENWIRHLDPTDNSNLDNNSIGCLELESWRVVCMDM